MANGLSPSAFVSSPTRGGVRCERQRNFISLLWTLACLPVWAMGNETLTGLGAQKNVTELIVPDGKGPFPAVLVLNTAGNVQKVTLTSRKSWPKKGSPAWCRITLIPTTSRTSPGL